MRSANNESRGHVPGKMQRAILGSTDVTNQTRRWDGRRGVGQQNNCSVIEEIYNRSVAVERDRGII